MTAIVEGFSLTHAEVLDGSTSFEDAIASAGDEWYDIYGVNEASLDPNTDSYDNTGDDVILSTWYWLNYADLTVQAGYISFPLLATLTGQQISSSGSGDESVFGIDIWREDTFNIAPKPVIASCLSRDSMGAVRKLTFGLYRVQFAPVTFDGPRYKDGLKVNYNGRVNMSAYDELGQAFGDGVKRPTRLLSTP